MTTRRGFLRLVGLGAAAGPATLSATAERAVGSHLGVGDPDAGWMTVSSLGQKAGIAGVDKSISVEALKLLGVPEWKKEEWRESARRVAVLDPDLAAMRSMSLSAKIFIQRQRNYRREEQGFWSSWARGKVRQKWHETFGYFDW